MAAMDRTQILVAVQTQGAAMDQTRVVRLQAEEALTAVQQREVALVVVAETLLAAIPAEELKQEVEALLQIQLIQRILLIQRIPLIQRTLLIQRIQLFHLRTLRSYSKRPSSTLYISDYG